MHELKLLNVVLNLFEGDAAGASGEAAPDAGESKGEVIYGKQPDAQPEAKPEDTGDADQKKTPEKVPFKELINGDYKEDFDNIFQKRFKDYKDLQKTNADQGAVLDMLMGKYGIQDGNLEALTKAIEDDDAMWESAAYEAGMTTEQYKSYQKLERENNRLRQAEQQIEAERQAQQQVAKWQAEADQLKAQYPDFDLERELLNEDFRTMVTRGISMDAAYKVAHFNDLMSGAVVSAAAQAEKKVTDNIRAKGSRPQENGTASQSAFTIKSDPEKWTKKDRAEVRRRVAMGEQIYL